MTAMPKPLDAGIILSSEIRSAREQSMRMALFATVVTLIIMFGNSLTAPIIELHARKSRPTMMAQVLPYELYDNDPTQDKVSLSIDGTDIICYRARLDGEISAFIIQISTRGFAGNIKLLVAANPDGVITGVQALSHNETQGLGDQIERAKSDWINQFEGLSLSNPTAEKWAVSKDGGEFDAFTGATVTPRAVISGIKTSLELIRDHQSILLGEAELESNQTMEDQ